MLIGLTGRPGAGQAAAADYLTNQGLAVVSADVLRMFTMLDGDVDIVVPDVSTPEAAEMVRSRGGFLLHLVNPTAPNLGPDPAIPLSSTDAEVHVPIQLFEFFDALDAVLQGAFDAAFEQ